MSIDTAMKYKPSVKLKWLLDSLESGRRETSKADTFEEGVLSIGGEHIGWHGEWILDNPRYISNEFYENMSTGKVTPNDVLLVKDGATIGKVAIANKDITPAAVNEHVFLLRFSKNQYPKFHFYVLQSKNIQAQIGVEIRGAAQPGLNSEFKNSVYFPKLPYEKQKKIADFLDKETARIDALIEEKQNMLDLLKEKRTALISHIVTCGIDPNVDMKPSGVEWIGKIPKDWQIMQLKRVWESAEYGISKSIKDEGDIRVLRMNSITKDGRIDILKSGKIDINEISSDLLLKKDDILFNRTNSLDQIAKVGMVDFEPKEPLTFASYLVRIRVNENVLPKYLVYLLNSSIFIKYARKNAIPAIGQANLNPTRYGEIHIVIPDTHKQKNIVEYIEKFDLKNSELQNELSKSIKLLQERRTALITAAVTGQLDIEKRN